MSLRYKLTRENYDDVVMTGKVVEIKYLVEYKIGH